MQSGPLRSLHYRIVTPVQRIPETGGRGEQLSLELASASQDGMLSWRSVLRGADVVWLKS